MTPRALDREVLRVAVVGPLAAPVGVVRVTDARRQPDAPYGVDHRVVRIGGVVPDRLRPEVAPRLEALRREHRRDLRVVVPERDLDHLRAVLEGVGHQQEVVADVDAVERAVRVDARVALVGRDLVVDEGDVVAPVPHRDDDVPLDALRPGRRRRGIAGRDPVGPLDQHVEPGLPAEAGDEAVHQRAALAPLHPVVPRGAGRVEIVDVGDLAGPPVAHLVAALAALQVVDPLALAAHERIDAVALGAGARELVRGGQLDERQPVGGRVDLGRFLRGRRHHRGEVELLIGPPGDRLGVDQPVAADPDLVGGVRQLRQRVLPVVVGDDDLAEHRLEVVGLRDHPDAGLGFRRCSLRCRESRRRCRPPERRSPAARRPVLRPREPCPGPPAVSGSSSSSSSLSPRHCGFTVSPPSSRSRAAVAGHALLRVRHGRRPPRSSAASSRSCCAR